MGLRLAGAKAVSGASTWALQRIFKRPAGNFPGKIALYINPRIIGDLSGRMKKGSIVVCGTNGKTTVTNLLADALEVAGEAVVCNRSGANLDSGIATALLQAKESDWGVFESDELWLVKSLAQLQAKYVILLNLFRDQLDRVGEINIIQDSIIEALASSPETTLVFNADDPFCAAIAQKSSNKSIPFGVAEPIEPRQVEKGTSVTQEDFVMQATQVLSTQASATQVSVAQTSKTQVSTAQVVLGNYAGQDKGTQASATQETQITQGVVDAQMCQLCSAMLTYTYRQYGQLGEYSCPNCGFSRPALQYFASEVRIGAFGLSFAVNGFTGDTPTIKAPYSGSYMIYNLLAAFVGAHLAGCSAADFQKALDAFDPQNGRLQELHVDGRSVLLNLAKNPTGFDQNIALILQDDQPKVVAFYVNDKEGDGRDISWLWDIGFEELRTGEDIFQNDIKVFAGGIRKNDLQVRLKYAGLSSELVESAEEVFSQTVELPQNYKYYFIANYTALPSIREELEKLADTKKADSRESFSLAENPIALDPLNSNATASKNLNDAENPHALENNGKTEL